MSEGTEKAILMVHQKLHELGYDVTGSDAAEVFIAAMDGVIEHVKDPRELGGALAGPGGAFDWGQTVIDASRAILVDDQEIAKVDPKSAGDNDETFACIYSGRINRTPDRASVMLLGDMDFMAATITEMHHVAKRAGLHDKLTAACERRWKQMPHNPYFVQRFRRT